MDVFQPAEDATCALPGRKGGYRKAARKTRKGRKAARKTRKGRKHRK